jgi:tetratricopeptide (TPR) repeat protein/tRNA A-37 threonylcarbamoyl transferase component Bud32
MKSMKDFFGSLFGQEQKPRQEDKPAAPMRREAPQQEAETSELYKKGDVIGGWYEIHGTLGKGGFGVVYLVYDRDFKKVRAVKTFRDELMVDAAAREAFKKEALLWVNLEEHPFILAASWIIEESGGRLFVSMEYVAPDDKGRVSLTDHLARAGGPLDAVQTLKWAIQFCLGMEHAQTHGIKCHRDIKPANILISQDGTLKISDFGLAAAAEVAWRGTGGRGGSLVTRGPEGSFGLSLMQTGGKARCGTPGYMAPEVYRGEGVDVRTDIYSFGLVLWQMATGSAVPPFVSPYRADLEGYMRETYEQQMAGRVPRVEGFLGPVIERCLCPKPAERWSSFRELRGVLEPILERKTGKKIEVPQIGEKTAVFWMNKGCALDTLGRREEAIGCLDRALAIDPRDARAWNNKGVALYGLGRHEEAINCYEQALAIDPRDAPAWFNKGDVLRALGRREEAIACYDKTLAIDPRLERAWVHKGNTFHALGRHEEAINCCAEALMINPRDVVAWNNKGTALGALGQREEAINCYNQALAIDPGYAMAWNNKGNALAKLGRCEEAISCFDRALALDPRYAAAWYDKGSSLAAVGRREEAISCFDQALAIDPRDAVAWYNKALAEDPLGRRREAALSYRRFIELAPPQYAQQIAHARQRLVELNSHGV